MPSSPKTYANILTLTLMFVSQVVVGASPRTWPEDIFKAGMQEKFMKHAKNRIVIYGLSSGDCSFHSLCGKINKSVSLIEPNKAESLQAVTVDTYIDIAKFKKRYPPRNIEALEVPMGLDFATKLIQLEMELSERSGASIYNFSGLDMRGGNQPLPISYQQFKDNGRDGLEPQASLNFEKKLRLFSKSSMLTAQELVAMNRLEAVRKRTFFTIDGQTVSPTYVNQKLMPKVFSHNSKIWSEKILGSSYWHRFRRLSPLIKKMLKCP